MANVLVNRNSRSKHTILRQVYEENRFGRAAVSTVSVKADPNTIGRRPARRVLRLLWFFAVIPLMGLAMYSMYPMQGFYPWQNLDHQSSSSMKQALIRASVETLLTTQSGSEPGVAKAVKTADVVSVAEDLDELRLAMRMPEESTSSDYQSLWSDPQVSIADLFDLGVKTIVIDAGHGGRDPGAIGPGGLQEKTVALDLARRLQTRLQRHEGYRILMTRDGDIALSLKERVEFANSNGADLFISLHVNALPVEQPTIVETYYFGPQTDKAAMRVAMKENHQSDYTIANFRDMIRKIGDSFKHYESKNLATAIHKSLYRNIKRQNKKFVSWGVKTAPFVVLLGVDTPSVLVEVTTLSNRREERRLRTKKYREKIAGYLEEGIVKYLNTTRPLRGPKIGANDDIRHTAISSGTTADG